MKNKTKILGILTAGALLGASSSAFADEQLLDVLVSNGFITEAQAESMKGSSDKDAVYVTPKRSDVKKLAIRGRAQWQFGYVSPDSDIEGAPTNDYSTFEIRRLRIGTQGALFQNLSFDIRANVLPEGADLDTAELVYTGLEGIDIGVGKTKPAIGMEESTSSTDILTVERSYPANFFAVDKNVGIWAEGDAGPVGLNVGIFNGENENENALDSDNDSHFLYILRAGFDAGDYLPDDMEGGIFFETVQNQDNDSEEAYQFEQAYSIGAEIEVGPFGLMGNYLWGTLTEDDNDVFGFVVMPWFYVTEKLQLVAQYNYLESDEGNAIGVQSRYIGRAAIDDQSDVDADEGNEWQAVYLGANYYIAGNNLKLMGGVEWAELTNTDDVTAVEAITVYGALRMRF
ncbi:MAG: porin [Verrucomicrobiota bacterium]